MRQKKSKNVQSAQKEDAVYKLDEKDRLILGVLQTNARLSTHEIAKRTLVPITTVHNRIKRMERSGVIKGYTVAIDNKRIGKILSAYVFATVDYRFIKNQGLTQHDIAKKIKTFPFVEEVSVITGASDIVAKIRVENIDQLDRLVVDKIRNIDGVAKTETSVVLAEA